VRVVGTRKPLEGIASGALEVAPPPPPTPPAPISDSTTRGQRWIIALIVAAAAGVFAASLDNDRRAEGVITFFFTVLASLGGAIGIRLAMRRLTPQMKTESELIHRIGVGGMASLFAAAFSFPFWLDRREPAGMWIAIFVPLFCMDAAAWAAPDRRQRVTFWDTVFLAGLFAFILSAIFDRASLVPVITLSAMCLMTQILSPWDRRAAAAASRQSQRPPPTTQATAMPAPSAPSTPATTTPPAALLTVGRIVSRLERRRLRREQRREQRRLRRTGSGVFFTLVTFLLLVPTAAVTLLTTIDLPKALSVGLPDTHTLRTLDREIFPGYPQWPELLLRIGILITSMLTILTLAACATARRRGGILHVLRGILGISTLLVSIALVGAAFSRNGWWNVAEQVHLQHAAAALAAFMDGFNPRALLLAAVTFMIATVLLAWPTAVADRNVATSSKQVGVA
jgi:hypothetical protein